VCILHDLCRKIGFKYVRKGKKAIIIDRKDTVVCHHDDLVIKAYGNKGRNVVYTDELWVNTETE
jgi:hypothetical protein